MKKSISQVCCDAKHLVQNGWIQGQSVKYRPRNPNAYCIAGAVWASCGGDRLLFKNVASTIEKTLDPATFVAPENELYKEMTLMAQYNDSVGRKKEEIVALLDKFC